MLVRDGKPCLGPSPPAFPGPYGAAVESGKDAATSMAPGLHLPRLAPQKESTSVPADASSPSAAARWPGLLHMPISESSPVTLVGQAWVIPTSRTGSGGLA